MENINQLIGSLINYVERVSQQFLTQEGMPTLFEDIRKSSKTKYTNLDYISDLMNQVVDTVAKNKNENFNDVQDRFIQKYLNP